MHICASFHSSSASTPQIPQPFLRFDCLTDGVGVTAFSTSFPQIFRRFSTTSPFKPYVESLSQFTCPFLILFASIRLCALGV